MNVLGCDILQLVKTILDIDHRLLREARLVAAREGTTGSALAEEGLRRVVRGKSQGRVFRLRKASFNGRGLCGDLVDANWNRIRGLAYRS
jgi:hypothetical protein